MAGCMAAAQAAPVDSRRRRHAAFRTTPERRRADQLEKQDARHHGCQAASAVVLLDDDGALPVVHRCSRAERSGIPDKAGRSDLSAASSMMLRPRARHLDEPARRLRSARSGRAARFLAICSVVLYESARRVVTGRGFCSVLSGEVPQAVCTVGPYRYIRHPVVYELPARVPGRSWLHSPALQSAAVFAANLVFFVLAAAYEERTIAHSPLGAGGRVLPAGAPACFCRGSVARAALSALHRKGVVSSSSLGAVIVDSDVVVIEIARELGDALVFDDALEPAPGRVAQLLASAFREVQLLVDLIEVDVRAIADGNFVFVFFELVAFRFPHSFRLSLMGPRGRKLIRFARRCNPEHHDPFSVRGPAREATLLSG